jgi:hypothetical protein
MPYPDQIELFDSGSGGLTTKDDGLLEREVTLKWLVPNKINYLQAETKAKQLAPAQLQGHRRTRIDIRSLGAGWWEIAAQYTNAAVQGEDGQDGGGGGGGGNEGVANTIAFDTTGATEHVTQVYTGPDKVTQAGITGQLPYWRLGEDALVPELEGAINVQGDQVNGVDRIVPIFNWTETWNFPSAYIVDEYVATLYELTGTINHEPWRIFNFGEVLFMGARAEITRGATMAAITFSFAARPNEFGFNVGQITGIKKNGWDHMSIMYESKASGGKLIRQPQFVFIDTIYPAKDFTRLAIGNQYPAVYLPREAFNNPGQA